MNSIKTRCTCAMIHRFYLDCHGKETDKTENYRIFSFPNLLHVGRCLASTIFQSIDVFKFFLLQTDDELLVILHGFIVKNIEGELTEANDLSDIF